MTMRRGGGSTQMDRGGVYLVAYRPSGTRQIFQRQPALMKPTMPTLLRQCSPTGGRIRSLIFIHSISVVLQAHFSLTPALRPRSALLLIKTSQSAIPPCRNPINRSPALPSSRAAVLKYTFGQAVSAYRSVSQVNAAIPVAMLQKEYNLYKGGTVNYNTEWKLTRIDSPSGAFVTFCYSLMANEDPIKEPVSLAVSRVDTDSYDIVTQYTRTTWQQRYWLDDISGSAGKKR